MMGTEAIEGRVACRDGPMRMGTCILFVAVSKARSPGWSRPQEYADQSAGVRTAKGLVPPPTCTNIRIENYT